ncbi:MAG: DUF2207 domain-containing protein [Acidimicrobiia bacterium]|nr:DUF2207 domain-containing protein [Acidimicrobiia bacterium]
MEQSTIVILAALAHLVAIAVALLAGYATYGREPRPVGEMPVRNQPPDDLSPGEVAALETQIDRADRAWTATVVDLVSRGVIIGGPVAEIAGDGTSETGYGVVRINDGRNLLEHEEAVRSLYAKAANEGAVARVDLRTAFRHAPQSGDREVAVFIEALRRRLTARAYAIVDARTFGWGVVATLTVAAAMTLLVLGTINAVDGDRLVAVGLGIAAGAIAGGVLAGTLARRPRLWVSRSDAGSRALGRWDAYRRYLEGSLGDWTTDPIGVSRGDRTTAYAIALGLMSTAEEAWSVALPRQLSALVEESVTPSESLHQRLGAT